MDIKGVAGIRELFPALSQTARGKGLVYLDSAATTLKPQSVVDRIQKFYELETANVHRGAHWLSDQATENFENTRLALRKFLNAKSQAEIIFTYGTTDGLNLLARTLDTRIEPRHNIVLTEMEHHSNLVPWHQLRERVGCEIRYIPVNDKGDLQLEALSTLVDENTVLVSVVHCSNTLGTLNDVKAIVAAARRVGALSIIDAAQSVACMTIDVQDIDCDFLVFSGHKMFGPYGAGVLYGKEDILNTLPPFRGGGSMIDAVTLEGSTYLSVPHRFEAGTPNISSVVAFFDAVKFIEGIGFEAIQNHEREVLDYAYAAIEDVGGLRVLGQPCERRNILPFVAEWAHPADIGQILDQQGVAVRTGHHCTQPLLRKFGLTGCARASFSIYSNREDVNALVKALKKAKELLA